jgi:hypothetical protein
MKVSILRACLVVAAAITAWRSMSVPPRASELLSSASDPTVLAWAITAGGPSDERWLESARRWAGNPALRAVILATLSGDDPWPRGLEEYVEDVARNGAGVDRTLARRALARHAALGG